MKGVAVRLTALAGVLLATVFASRALAAETTYANTCIGHESGDLGGYMVTWSDNNGAPVITFRWSEEGLTEPVRAVVSQFERKSGRVAFSVPTESGTFYFRGRRRRGVLEGELTTPWKAAPDAVELEQRSPELAFRPPECN